MKTCTRSMLLNFLFVLVTGPRRSLSLELSDTRVYEPQIRAHMKPCTRCVLLNSAAFSLPSEEATTYFFKDFYLKAKSRIWPGLSYVCPIRSTAVQQSCLARLGIQPKISETFSN